MNSFVIACVNACLLAVVGVMVVVVMVVVVVVGVAIVRSVSCPVGYAI